MSPAVPPAAPPATSLNPPLKAKGSFRFQEIGLLVVVALLTLILSGYGYHKADPTYGQSNTFFNMQNLVSGIAVPMSYFAIMAVGLTIVIISGGIDISVASIMALSAMTTVWALTALHKAEAPAYALYFVSLLLPLAVGTICGLINGLLVVSLRMHPFIVTLGTLAIFRCAANTIPFANSKTLSLPKPLIESNTIISLMQKEAFVREVDGYKQPGVQLWLLAFMFLAVILGWIYLSLTSWGRETFAVGGNEEAARYSGVNVGLVKLRVYVISGLCAGLAGLITLGRFRSVTSNTALGYELTVVAAAVVGGAALTGGRGTALGALLGALILALIENGIAILGLNQELKLGIVGASIIIAVALDNFSQSFRNRRAKGSH